MTFTSKSIVYFVMEDWYFCSHRLALAAGAKEAGYTVHVITNVREHASEIREAGLILIPFKLSRRSKNPFVEVAVIWRLWKTYRNIQPTIVHHVAIKPVIYGSIAARLAGVPRVVNAIAGLGFLFSSRRLLARALRVTVKVLLRRLLSSDRTTVILQNPDDVELLCGEKIVNRSRVELIRGSGVDTDVYRYVPELNSIPIVLLASRMLWDKGVGDFVAAARALRSEGMNCRFVLAGESDDGNPGSISVDQLDSWNDQGDIEWWGRCTDMPSIFAKTHVVCLPTAYGEGVPKVLIEAASCGRPIVATDAPGCREIVIDGQNGTLIPVGDVDALTVALRTLLNSPEKRRQMGRAGRKLVKDLFSMERVIDETMMIYNSVE